jgi:hypothetical protein
MVELAEKEQMRMSENRGSLRRSIVTNWTPIPESARAVAILPGNHEG